MSTLKLENIQHPDAASASLTFDSDGSVAATGNVSITTGDSPLTLTNTSGSGYQQLAFKVGTQLGRIVFTGESFADANYGQGDITIQTQSSGGQIRFGTGAASVNDMVIDASGRITMPSQPAFLAIHGGGDAIANATGVTIAFNNEKFDQGGDFSSTTFTAPVTGRYLFTWSVRVDAGGSSNTRFSEATAYLVTSNRNYYIKPGTVYSDADDRFEISGSALADMDASDTARIDVFFSRYGASGGTTTVGDVNNPTTHFSGHLVC